MLSRTLLAAAAGLGLMALGACAEVSGPPRARPMAPAPSHVIPPPPPIDVLRPK